MQQRRRLLPQRRVPPGPVPLRSWVGWGALPNLAATAGGAIERVPAAESLVVGRLGAARRRHLPHVRGGDCERCATHCLPPLLLLLLPPPPLLLLLLLLVLPRAAAGLLFAPACLLA